MLKNELKGILISLIIQDPDTKEVISRFYRDYTCIVLTDYQLLENLNTLYTSTLVEIIEGTHTDTCVRGEIMSGHANLMTGRDWPTYGDGEEYAQAFNIDLDNAYKEKGYEMYED